MVSLETKWCMCTNMAQPSKWYLDLRRSQCLLHVCTISENPCSTLSLSCYRSFCGGSFEVELLEVFAHRGDAFPVVWYLLGTRISFQIENPQICHPHEDLATRTISVEHAWTCMNMHASYLQQVLHSSKIIRPNLSLFIFFNLAQLA